MCSYSKKLIFSDFAFFSRLKSIPFIFYLLSFSILACGVMGCQTIPEPEPIEKDGKVYGITEGSFRSRWWNYYERGLSFADGQFWEQARSDFKRAMAQRDKDQWRARTYGFHFVDYFPHRETGIVYFHQGLFEKAIDELTRSLSFVKTAKAQLYLDRARKALIEKRRLDKRPPEVDIQSMQDPLRTNALSILIQGIARDDTFVRLIQVGDKKVSVDVSSPQIPFAEEVPLVAGRNQIPVVVTDLMGKSTQVLLTIDVDRAGPVIRIDSPAEGGFSSGEEISFRGVAYDDGGLAKLTLNGREIACDGAVEFEIEQTVSLGRQEDKIVVQARDLAGNVTTAEITSAGREGQPRQAATEVETKDLTPPYLHIRNIEKEHRTYLRQAFIEGSVRDDREVKHLFINGRQILNNPGRNIYFSHLVALEEGVNRIAVQGIDAAGNEEKVEIKIVQETAAIRDVGSRLRVAVHQFQRKSIGDDRQMSYGMEDLLTGAMIDRARFSAIERQHLETILLELKLSKSGLVDEKTALKLGRLLAADCMVFGHVLERADSIEAYTRIVDCETAQILAAVDVYGEDVDISTLRTLSQGLELKLTQELPVVEGLVVNTEGDRFIMDLGKASRIKSGMKLIVFEIVESLKQSAHDTELAIGYRELGQARTKAVMEKSASAEMVEETDSDPIQVNYFVITR